MGDVDKTLVTCCFILDGDLAIDEGDELKQEIEEVVKKYCYKNNISKYERTFLSDNVVDMITEFNDD